MTVIQTYLVYILAALLLVSVGVNVVYHFDRASLKKDNTELTASVKQLGGMVAAANATIIDQNTKILSAANAAKTTQQTINELGTKLAAQSTANTALISKMMSQPAPKTCNDAKTYLKNNIGIYQW